MPIWKARPISEVPSIILTSWGIHEVSYGNDREPSRHFVGYNQTEYEGRVSSAIQSFDKESMVGITRSGRVYKLVGEPGYNGDALYVWETWKHYNGVTESKNVSKDVLVE